MVRTLKALRLFNHILLGLVLLVLTGAIWNNKSKLLKATKQWWLYRITQLMGMEIEIQGHFPDRGKHGLLFVSNHISWTDIPVIGGLTQLNFLSKAEVKNWPLVGRLAQSTGTLFIQRGSGDTHHIAKQMAAYLQEGRSVLFFPEGTTSDGRTVGRFHRKLFHTCNYVETQVCPVAIHYQVADLDHNPVAFIGDDEFTQHIWNLLAFDRIRVTVTVLAPRPLVSEHFEQQISQIRKEISDEIEMIHARRRINTNVQWPDASSPDDRQDEAASY